MSGFTRDSKYYGDRLVYEVLDSKWRRYHERCGCEDGWISHVEPAGFTIVRARREFVALTGPGLTEDVDETRLTTNALWEAVTGQEGAQHWFEPVRVIDRSEKAEAERKAENDRVYGERRERAAAAKREPITPAQLQYLTKLVTQVSRERFYDDFAAAIKGSTVEPRRPRETTKHALKRLTKATARTLITRLTGRA
ncbi:hypothetical protein [Amycolatopsis sp. FDAARGOS 1241]|uniref:hypothetical protein n=1 Tax=Amycolatopsis sp. FDAARGOS 1241 TaxID=2778070 RepID=UPI001951B32D|nr:hypothetical protein [Amycolatopsis sp. FDAARGOS 1241]QRP43038.1 hypothetical protein I6J71_26800 [Amycolatopsis sp. FDAARGOS 1241]